MPEQVQLNQLPAASPRTLGDLLLLWQDGETNRFQLSDFYADISTTYYTKGEVDDFFGDVYTKIQTNDILGDYVTSTELSTALGSYATTNFVTTNYVSNSSLAAAGYLTASTADGLYAKLQITTNQSGGGIRLAGKGMFGGRAADSGEALQVQGAGLVTGTITSNNTISSTNGSIITYVSFSGTYGAIGSNSNLEIAAGGVANRVGFIFGGTRNWLITNTASPVDSNYKLQVTGNQTALGTILTNTSLAYTTGTNVYTGITVAPIINTTGGSNTIRGIYYNPTLTSVTGTTHRAWENTTGDIVFNSVSGSVITGPTATPMTIQYNSGLTAHTIAASGGLYLNRSINTPVYIFNGDVQFSSTLGTIFNTGVNFQNTLVAWGSNSVLRVDSGGSPGGRGSWLANGNLLIGQTVDAGFKLDVGGAFRSTASATIGTFGAGTSTISGANATITTSTNTTLTSQGTLSLGGTATLSQSFVSNASATNAILTLAPTLNLSVGPHIFRGVYYNPPSVSIANTSHRAWENLIGDMVFCTNSGSVGFRTISPTALADINGLTGYNQLRLRASYTPTGTSDSNGNTGDYAWDENFLYVKVAAGWKRSVLSTF